MTNPTQYLRNFSGNNTCSRQSLADFIKAVDGLHEQKKSGLTVTRNAGQINFSFNGASFTIGQKSVNNPTHGQVDQARSFANKLTVIPAGQDMFSTPART